MGRLYGLAILAGGERADPIANCQREASPIRYRATDFLERPVEYRRKTDLAELSQNAGHPQVELQPDTFVRNSLTYGT